MAAALVSCWLQTPQNPAAARQSGFFNARKIQMNKLAWLLYLIPCAAQAVDLSDSSWGKFEYDFEEKPWVELEAQLPPAPKEENLLPFYASSATDNRFFVDSASVTVSADGVVRYILAIKSSANVMNISFEGMRCSSVEVKRYAFGRANGDWGKARNARWEPVTYKDANRHHYMLFTDFFCPHGIVVKTAAEAINAIKRGEHPESKGIGL